MASIAKLPVLTSQKCQSHRDQDVFHLVQLILEAKTGVLTNNAATQAMDFVVNCDASNHPFNKKNHKPTSAEIESQTGQYYFPNGLMQSHYQ